LRTTTIRKTGRSVRPLGDVPTDLTFCGVVPDTVMIDRDRADLFAALGRTPGPFRGLAYWPELCEALSARSEELLAQLGPEEWVDRGGICGDDGRLSASLVSPLAAEVIACLADDPGGLLWTGNDGTDWAVRLVPAGSRQPGSYFGFAIGWRGPGRPPRRPAKGNRVARKGLMGRARALRLSRRTEQILVALHAAVVSQRSSIVLVPDVSFGEVIWGGQPRPRDWRADVFDALRSLLDLRAEVLRVPTDGWRPHLGMESVAVATVEELWDTRPDEDGCRPACPLWGRDAPHHHFLVQVGCGFLGVMEKFATASGERTARVYEFARPGPCEPDDELSVARKAGRLVSISLPTALFGPAPWSGLTPAYRGIIQGLMGEVTRARAGPKTRNDHARVFRGNLVPGPGGGPRVYCPLLAADGRHVAFGGNGRRFGMGYRLVGKSGTGWLFKCGYPVSEDGRELLRVVRRFLDDLEAVGRVLNLTVVGLDPYNAGWRDLAQLRALAERAGQLPELLRLHVRVYGPEDYLHHCREHFAAVGNFRFIPGGAGRGNTDPEQPTLDLGARLRGAGFTQSQLARHLEVSQPFISQLENLARPWPERLRERAEELLRERAAQVERGVERF
jgi:hypothetical protein